MVKGEEIYRKIIDEYDIKYRYYIIKTENGEYYVKWRYLGSMTLYLHFRHLGSITLDIYFDMSVTIKYAV